MRPTRRSVLQALGATAISPIVGCGDGAPTDPTALPIQGALRPLNEVIDTVVILMMENRSFDHYFGAYSLLENRIDVAGLRPGMANRRHNGTSALIHPAGDFCVGDPPHAWDSCHQQYNGGRNDGFVSEYEARFGDGVPAHPMGYFDRSTLPVFYALADQYALCHNWHCSLLAGTWPNRFFSHSASSGGVQSNRLDEALVEMPSVYRNLDAAGLSWNDYFSNLPFGALISDADLGSFRLMDEFWEDAASGNLANVNLIEPFYGICDDHPPTHPKAGQVFVASVYDALVRSPQWHRTLLVITYDEHGGFHDHVAPPQISDERAELGFGQMGFRVPSIVVSPWVKAAHVSNTLLGHSSIPAFYRTLWGLDPLNQRDLAAGDLTEVIDLGRVRDERPLDDIIIPSFEANEAEIYAEECGGPKAGRATRSLAQPELEDWFDARPQWRERLDYRRTQEQGWERLVARAEKRGLVRRKI